jgi:hypothetical protein
VQEEEETEGQEAITTEVEVEEGRGGVIMLEVGKCGNPEANNFINTND